MKLTYSIPGNDSSLQKRLNENLNYPFFVCDSCSVIKVICKLLQVHVVMSLFLSSGTVDTNFNLH
jgi:hypothetical protein